MDRPTRNKQRVKELTRSLNAVVEQPSGNQPVGQGLKPARPPSFDAATARRMAQASDVAYFIDEPGGVTSCPLYGSVGYQSVPTIVDNDKIHAALVGTTATEVLVAFRGTLPLTTDDPNAFFNSLRDWLDDFHVRLVPTAYTSGEVSRGLRDALDLVWPPVLDAIRQQQSQSQLPVIITGHSKGGGMARLAALRLQTDTDITPAVYTYGAARSGNTDYVRDYAARIQSDWRFENADDVVPRLPPTADALDIMAASLIDPTTLPRLLSHVYAHVGLLEFLNWQGGVTEGDSLLLQGLRTVHLAEIIAAADYQQIVTAHSLEQSYLPRL